MIVAHDTAAGMMRRSLEATKQFCESSGVDKDITVKVDHYFKYLNDKQRNQHEESDVMLLSRSFRCEFVCSRVMRSLQQTSPVHCKHSFLDTPSLQYGFLSSLARVMEFYIAVPGEVLAKNSMSDVLALSGTSSRPGTPLQGATQEEGDQSCFSHLGYTTDLYVLRKGDVGVSMGQQRYDTL